MASILELAVWKAKIHESKTGDERQEVNNKKLKMLGQLYLTEIILLLGYLMKKLVSMFHQHQDLQKVIIVGMVQQIHGYHSHEN